MVTRSNAKTAIENITNTNDLRVNYRFFAKDEIYTNANCLVAKAGYGSLDIYMPETVFLNKNFIHVSKDIRAILAFSFTYDENGTPNGYVRDGITQKLDMDPNYATMLTRDIIGSYNSVGGEIIEYTFGNDEIVKGRDTIVAERGEDLTPSEDIMLRNVAVHIGRKAFKQINAENLKNLVNIYNYYEGANFVSERNDILHKIGAKVQNGQSLEKAIVDIIPEGVPNTIRDKANQQKAQNQAVQLQNQGVNKVSQLAKKQPQGGHTVAYMSTKNSNVEKSNQCILN